MNLKERTISFVKLGKFIHQLFSHNTTFVSEELEDLKLAIDKSESQNNWFSKENILHSLQVISEQLTEENFDAWLTPYNLSDSCKNKKVLIIMAGNIPLVGFHDLLSVIISGNHAIVKLSSNDNVLLPFLWKVLCGIDDFFIDRLEYIDDLKDRNFDAIIATGSDNSSKYFEYYFKSTRRIIRRNRRSIALISGKETDRELKGLANDVFMYFGLGCRSVSKLFLPKGYDLDKLFHVFYPYKEILNHKKYANNYHYNKTIFLMGKQKLTENGFLIMKEDSSFHSPVAVLYYEYYKSLNEPQDFIFQNEDSLQCVASKEDILKKHVPFGKTQRPELWDYADNVDTIEFLIKI